MLQILVVEDGKNMCKLVEVALKNSGFHPIMACNGEEALKLLDKHLVSPVILDIVAPDIDGCELTKQLWASDCNLPILMVTARQLPEDERKGSIMRTNDYMTKPVDEGETIPRIKALLRRVQVASERKIAIGDVILDYGSLTVTRDSNSQTLPRKKSYLPYRFLPYLGKIFTRIQLVDKVWGMESESDDNTINVHTNQPHKCFEAYPKFIAETICGLGYKAVKNV